MNWAHRRALERSSKGRNSRTRWVGAGTAGVMVAAGIGAALTSAAAPASSAAPTTPAPKSAYGQTLTPSEAVAAGVYKKQVTVASDGATTYKYTYSDGPVVTSVIPPAGFRPLTATAQELAKYGFPPRPTNPATLASWTQAMAAWKETVTPDLAVQITPSSSTTGSTASGGGKDSGAKAAGGSTDALSTEEGYNWAGYIDGTTSSEPYAGAQSVFEAPTLGSSCRTFTASTPTSVEIGIWTGLGGYSDPDKLIQSGVVAGLDLPGETSVWQPFWEVYSVLGKPQPLKSITQSTLMHISPGDVIYSETFYSSTTDGIADFYIENETTHVASVYLARTNPLTGPISDYYTGLSADFIVEDPGGTQATVPFSEFAMTQSESYKDGGWGALATHDPTRLYNTRITPGSIGSTKEAFAMRFLGCPS